jgi:hypothetical protein
LLRSKTLLGHSTHDGNTVRDDQGDPIMIGPALVTAERFTAVQTALDNTALKVTNRSANASPLLGILVCPLCERLMHLRQNHSKARGKTYRYYQCLGGKNSGAKPEHPAHILKADQVEEQVYQFMLDTIGDQPEKTRTWIPACDTTAALHDVQAAITDLTDLYTTAASETMRSRITTQLAALDRKAAELENTPTQEGRWEYRLTGRNNGDVWETLSQDDRRQWILDSGIQVTVNRLHPDLKPPRLSVKYLKAMPE